MIEVEDSSLLVKPKIKKNSNFPKLYAFPIVRRDSHEENAPWNCVIGHLKEQCVEITDERNMKLLFTMGFFGKGSLSRSTPQVLEKIFKEQRNALKQKKVAEEKSENSTYETIEDNGKEDRNPAKRRKKDEIEVVLSDTNDTTDEDSDSCSSESVDDTSKSYEKETLQLTLEEAFFLSYGLGVLVVKDKDQFKCPFASADMNPFYDAFKPLDLMRLWHKFCELHPSQNFPTMYTAYHHFRSKGWIVRSGMKYGADFALYKDGPPFYHSSYVVIVKPTKEQNLRDIAIGGRSNLTWSSLAGMNRVCSQVSKAIIILYVIKPTTISENKISTPFCVSQYKLEEVLVHRWVPSADRGDE